MKRIGTIILVLGLIICFAGCMTNVEYDSFKNGITIQPIEMTVSEFITALGNSVETITYNTTQSVGVNLSKDSKSANVYGIKLTGEFSINADAHFPNTLISADLRGLDTRSVTNMSFMFDECKALQTLNLSSFNTSNVTDIKNMFYSDNIEVTICSGWTLTDTDNFGAEKISFKKEATK